MTREEKALERLKRAAWALRNFNAAEGASLMKRGHTHVRVISLYLAAVAYARAVAAKGKP